MTLDPCATCGSPLRETAGGGLACAWGHVAAGIEFQEASDAVQFRPAEGLREAPARAASRGRTFRAVPRAFRARGRAAPKAAAPVARAPPARRSAGSGIAVTLALLLVAGGLATASYILLTEPDAAALFDLNGPRSLRPADRAPEDYQAPVAVDGNYHREFEWSFRGKTYTWSMDIPQASYDHFRRLDRPMRSYEEGGVMHIQPAYDILVSNPDDDRFINELAQALVGQSRRDGMSEDQALSFTLAFVQSLPYTKDDVTAGRDEYPRFPVETLVDNGGDCEDSAILYSSLVVAMGYGAVLLSPPQHMAVGVAAAPDVAGVAYTYQGQRYLYAETTGDDWKIGEVPDEYRNQPAVVYDLDPKPLLSLQATFGAVTRDGRQEIRLNATQTGSADANGVRVVAVLRGADGALYDRQTCEVGIMPQNTYYPCLLHLDLGNVPRGRTVTISCWIEDEAYRYDEVGSNQWVPRP